MVKRKNRVFNKRLYVEGLIQTKWIALSLFVLGILVIFTFSSVMVGGIGLGIVFYSSTALMTYQLYHFLNKRPDSDFFHGMSQGRSVLYISYSLSILTWIAGILLVLLAIACFIHNDTLFMLYRLVFEESLTNEHFMENIIMTILLYGYYFAGCLLILGATLLAMSLTGNVMANIASVFAILFVPRTMILGFADGFFNICSYVSKGDILAKITDSSYNAVYGLLKMFDPSVPIADMEQFIHHTIVVIVYSVIVGIIYMVLGGVAFSRRKSEVAGGATLNRIFQILLRVVLTMMVCVTPIMIVTRCFTNERTENILWKVVCWYVFAVFVWLLIELLTTKNHRLMLSSLRQIPIVVLLNVVCIVGLVVTIENVAKAVPKIDDLTLVEMQWNEAESQWDEEESQWNSNFISYSLIYWSDYMASILEDAGCLKFTSEEAKELLVTALGKEVEQSHAAYEEDVSMNGEYHYIWNVCFHKGDKTMTRSIHFDREAAERINEYIEESASNTYDYPFPIWEPEKLKTKTSYDGGRFAGTLTEKSMKQLYACLYKEIKPLKMSLYEWLGNSDADASVIDSIYVDYSGKQVNVPISRDTPKTLEYLMNAVNEKNEYFRFDYFTNQVIRSSDYASGEDLTLMLCPKDEKKYVQKTYQWGQPYYGEDASSVNMEDDKLQQLRDILCSYEKGTEITTDKDILLVSYFYRNTRKFQWFNLTEEELKVVEGLMVNPDRINEVE